MTAEDECGTVETPADTATALVAGQWANLGMAISANPPVTDPGQVRTLCIVRTWEEDLGNGVKARRFGTPAVVTASTPPAALTNAIPSTNRTDRKTTALSWTFMVDSGLKYEVRALTTSRDGATTRPDADACDGSDSRTAPPASSQDNVTVTHRETSPDPYAQYDLCVRASNEQGMSDWAITGTGQDTLPGQPSKPTYQRPPISEVWSGPLARKTGHRGPTRTMRTGSCFLPKARCQRRM